MNVVKLAHRLSPYVVGAEGNVSCRFLNGFLIKGSGYSFENLKSEEMAECDIDGNQIGKVRPSMEAAFHSMLYKLNPDINYIAHTHPVNCLKILMNHSATQEFAKRRYFPDQVIFNGMRSCVVEYAKPGEPLAIKMKEAIENYNHVFPDVILLRNHGIVCCGKNYNQAIVKTEICEKAATCVDNDSEPLSFLNCLDLIRDENEQFRKELKLTSE